LFANLDQSYLTFCKLRDFAIANDLLTGPISVHKSRNYAHIEKFGDLLLSKAPTENEQND